MVMSMTVIGFTTVAIHAAKADAFRQRVSLALDRAVPRIKHSEAATAMGVSEKHLSDFLRGLRPMSAERFEALPQSFHDEYDRLKATERGWLLVAEPHLIRLCETLFRVELVMAKCDLSVGGQAFNQMINPVSQKVAS